MNRWTALLAGPAMAISAPAAAQEAVGDWQGTLDLGGQKLRLVFHIARGADGKLTGTLDSLDQGAFGIPLGDIALEANRLIIAVPSVSGAYTAEWDAAARGWRGSWTQGGASLPLALAPGGPPPEQPREPDPLPANWEVPTNAAIEEAIAARIAPRDRQGIVVGVLEPEGRRIVAGGPKDGEPFDGDTLFEIGSISKVFTALILADMANKGEVSLDDPAAKYLPEGATMPERGGKQITLRHLATHTSGLPRLPDNMPYGDLNDPYADYTEALMLDFLRRYQLPRDIGAKHEYSNFAFGLLGYLLGRAAESRYETLLRERITGPLGMNDTAIALSPDQKVRLSQGHDAFMRSAKPWRLPFQEGAGAIRSTARDMLKFAAAALDSDSPIAPAMEIALAERVDTGLPRTEQALGWQVFHPEPDRDVLFHNGGTGGYRSALGLEPSTGTAVLALTNTAAEPPTTDLVLHMLVGSTVAPTPPVPPAPPPPTARVEATLPAAEFDRVVGRYEFSYGLVIDVMRKGDTLWAQRQGAMAGPALQLHAEAPLEFFLRAVDAQLRFITDETGTVIGAVLTANGEAQTGKRVAP